MTSPSPRAGAKAIASAQGRGGCGQAPDRSQRTRGDRAPRRTLAACARGVVGAAVDQRRRWGDRFSAGQRWARRPSNGPIWDCVRAGDRAFPGDSRRTADRSRAPRPGARARRAWAWSAIFSGAKPTAAARVSWLGDGRTILRQLTVTGAALTVTGSGSAGPARRSRRSRGGWSATNAARLAPGMKGGCHRGPERATEWSQALDVHGGRQGGALRHRLADADRLLGPSPTLSLDGAFDGKVLNLDQGVARRPRRDRPRRRASSAPRGELQLALTWRAAGPIPVGPLEIDGAVTGRGDIGGTLVSPTADLIADLARLDLPSLPLRDAHLVVRLASASGGVGAQASSRPRAPTAPPEPPGRLHVAGARFEVSDLDASAGGLGLKGGFALAAGAPSRADLTWSPRAGRLSGGRPRLGPRPHRGGGRRGAGGHRRHRVGPRISAAGPPSASFT